MKSNEIEQGGIYAGPYGQSREIIAIDRAYTVKNSIVQYRLANRGHASGRGQSLDNDGLGQMHLPAFARWAECEITEEFDREYKRP